MQSVGLNGDSISNKQRACVRRPFCFLNGSSAEMLPGIPAEQQNKMCYTVSGFFIVW